MGIARRVRIAQKRRWRPTLVEIVNRTLRKHSAHLFANMCHHNAIFARMTRRH